MASLPAPSPAPDKRIAPDFLSKLEPHILSRARDLAFGFDFDDLATSYARGLASRKAPPADLAEAFLSYLRRITKSGPGPASTVAIDVRKFGLTAATYEQAAAVAPGWDVAELDRIAWHPA